MKSQLLKCLLLMLLTALLTYFITCHFGLCRKGDDDNGGTRTPTTICMDYNTVPPATLTTKMVKSMVGQYSDAQLNNIQNATTNAVPVDARSIWFDLETLKQFMYQIEHNAANNFNESNNKTLGVRIYYAAYPENAKMREMTPSQTDPNFSYNPAYEKLHTLVMIPTITGADKENYDFNPLDVTTYNGFTKMPKGGKYYTDDDYVGLSLGTSANPASVSIATQSNTTNNAVNARNHGLLTPPETIIGVAY